MKSPQDNAKPQTPVRSTSIEAATVAINAILPSKSPVDGVEHAAPVAKLASPKKLAPVVKDGNKLLKQGMTKLGIQHASEFLLGMYNKVMRSFEDGDHDSEINLANRSEPKNLSMG
jgi:hypothetical protein